MAFCTNCGNQLTEGAKFCPKCGTAVEVTATQEKIQQPEEQPTQQQQEQQGESFFTAAMNNTADTTSDFNPKDIEDNKIMALLSYLGILVLVPIFGAKESKFARFHANQGLILCVAAIVYGVAYSILSEIIMAISWRLHFLVSLIGLVSIVFVILAIMGIINVVNGKAKELPIIGKYKILK